MSGTLAPPRGISREPGENLSSATSTTRFTGRNGSCGHTALVAAVPPVLGQARGSQPGPSPVGWDNANTGRPLWPELGPPRWPAITYREARLARKGPHPWRGTTQATPLALDAPRRCLEGVGRVVVAARPGEPPPLNVVHSFAGVPSNLGVSKNMPFIVEISFSVA
jgi:hypothetical protein